MEDLSIEYEDVKFSVTGEINGETDEIVYEYKDKKGHADGGKMSMFMLKCALERITSVGPVGMYMDRDINNPLAMLFILNSKEIFQKVLEVKLISGTMPVAPAVPEGAIC